LIYTDDWGRNSKILSTISIRERRGLPEYALRYRREAYLQRGTMEKQDSAKKIGYYLERTTRIVKLSYLQAFAQLGVDITPEQWVMLDSLYQRNGQSQTELAGDSYKNAPTVSRILDLLEKKGLVERQRFANDRRRYKIFLTKEGQVTVEKVKPAVATLREQGWQQLTDADYSTFLRIMNQIFENLRSNTGS